MGYVYIVYDGETVVAASPEYETARRLAHQLYKHAAEHVAAVPLVTSVEVE